MHLDNFINQFWVLDAEYDFSCLETRFYFFLLDVAVAYETTQDIQLTNFIVCTYVGCSKHSMKRARGNLQKSGLITYEIKEGRKVGSYEINLLFKKGSEEINLYDFATEIYKRSYIDGVYKIY